MQRYEGRSARRISANIGKGRSKTNSRVLTFDKH